MRCLFAVAALLSIALPSAAINAATNEEIAAIQGHIDQLHGLTRQIAVNQSILATANPTERAALLNKIRGLQQQRDVQGDIAIHLALRAYGLGATAPDGTFQMPTGTLVNRFFAGKTATWIPVFGEISVRPTQDAHGKRIELKPRSDSMGVTGADGVTILSEAVFTSPNLLALALLHERIHFDQFVTPGSENLSEPAREVPAYQAQYTNLNKLNLTPVERKYEEDYLINGFIDGNGMPQPGYLTKWREDLRQEKASGRLIAPWSSGIAKSGPLVHSIDEISRLQSRFDDLQPTVDEELEYVRELTRRQKEIDETPPPITAAPAAEDPAEKLGRLLIAACQYENRLTDEMVLKEFPSGMVDRKDFGECESGADLYMPPGCARFAFKDLCRNGPETIYLSVESLRASTDGLRLAPAVPAPPARRNPAPTPTPSSPDLPMNDPGKPDKEPKDPGTRHSPRPPRPGSWNDH